MILCNRLVESLCKNHCLLQLLSSALALDFSPGPTYQQTKIEPRKVTTIIAATPNYLYLSWAR
jgi:hypothetical protein